MFKAYIDGVCFYDDIENNESISDLILTLEEKKNLIKILRAQLSNPELYVLFFNIIKPRIIC